MKKCCSLWALSYQFDWGRSLLGQFCFVYAKGKVTTTTRGKIAYGLPIALFGTRSIARDAQTTCCYSPTRVEHVTVTIEVDVEAAKAKGK